MILTKHKTVKLNKIKIPESFLECPPNPEKIVLKTINFIINRKSQEKLHVDKEYMLFDDYITYLILKALGVKKVKVIICTEKKQPKG